MNRNLGLAVVAGMTYQVDDEALKRAAEAMRLPVATLRAALDKFDQTIKELGEPWGDDEIGEQWAAIYLPGLAKIRAGLGSVGTGLDDLADKIDFMALLHLRTEEANQS